MSTSCVGSTVDQRVRKWELPPLILHPFDNFEPGKEIEILKNEGLTENEVTTRYAELRMLCFIGKDLTRWLEHCAEIVSGEPEHQGITEASLIRFLLFDPPVAVVRKMREWEVGNYQLIFSRALGLNAVFSFPPAPKEVSGALLRNFHAYADALFDARVKLKPGLDIQSRNFDFGVYASAEYIALLEKSWSGLPES